MSKKGFTEEIGQYYTMLLIPQLKRVADMISMNQYFMSLKEFQLLWDMLYWFQDEEDIKGFYAEMVAIENKAYELNAIDRESWEMSATNYVQRESRPLAMKCYHYTWTRLSKDETFRLITMGFYDLSKGRKSE